MLAELSTTTTESAVQSTKKLIFLETNYRTDGYCGVCLRCDLLEGYRCELKASTKFPAQREHAKVVVTSYR